MLPHNHLNRKITREQLSSMRIENVVKFYGGNPIDPASAANALRIIATDDDKRKLLGLGNMLGYGGFKQVYEYQNKPGYVIALRNMSFEEVEEGMAKRWCEAVYEEKAMSDLCLNAGLRAQNFEIIHLKVDGFEVPALLMPSFELLNSHGQQVRDLKNMASSFGQSLIYGYKENLTADYLRELFDYVIDDIVSLIINGIPVGRDTSNLVIEDTQNSPKYNRLQDGHFMERKQILKLFLFDFTSKHKALFPLEKIDLIGDNGKPNHELITQMALHYFNRAYEILTESVSNDELTKLTGTHVGLSLVLAKAEEEIKTDVVKDIVDVTLQKLKELKYINKNAEEKCDTLGDLRLAIGNMKTYGINLKNEGAPKGVIVADLAKQLNLKLSTFINEKDYSYKKVRQFKQEFDVLLNSQNEEMRQYRFAWWTIIKNIGIALIPVLGLLAIASQLIYSTITKGRTLFFYQKERTTSEDKAAEVRASLKNIRGTPPR